MGNSRPNQNNKQIHKIGIVVVKYMMLIFLFLYKEFLDYRRGYFSGRE